MQHSASHDVYMEFVAAMLGSELAYHHDNPQKAFGLQENSEVDC